MESNWNIPFVSGVQATPWKVNYLFPVYSQETEDKKLKMFFKAAPLRISGVTSKTLSLCIGTLVFFKEWNFHVTTNPMI